MPSAGLTGATELPVTACKNLIGASSAATGEPGFGPTGSDAVLAASTAASVGTVLTMPAGRSARILAGATAATPTAAGAGAGTGASAAACAAGCEVGEQIGEGQHCGGFG